MNKRGKIALSLVIVSLVLFSILLLTNIKTAKSEAWQDWLTLEYNTEQCLAKCEAIFIITNPTNYDVVLGSNDFNVWHETFNGGGLTKPIEVYKEEEIISYVDIPEYGTCYNQMPIGNMTCSEMGCIDQGTYCDCPYQCQTGSHQEERIRKEYQSFSFSGKTLHANELWRIKLIGYKKPSLEKNDVEWLINFKGMQPPWDWWNASCDFRIPLNVTENNATVLTNYPINATIIATANLDNVDETRVLVDNTMKTAFRWNTTTFTEGEPHVLWWNTNCSASTTCTDYLYYGCTGFPNAESDVSSYAVDINHTKGYWLFDDSWNDESTNSYTLATGGNPTFAMGKYGSRAVVFDGDDDANVNIPVTTYPIATSMTIEMWIKPDSTLDASSSTLAFVSHAMGGSADWTGWNLIHFGNQAGNEGELGFGYGDGADYAWITSVQTFNAGTWYHIAYTFDGTVHSLYVNGILVAETTDAISINTNTVYDFTVGARRYASHSPTLFFTGTIDEVRYLNKSLNPNEFVARAIEPTTVTGPEEAYDLIPPTWSDPKTNGSNLTKNGDTIYFNITLKDNKTGGNYFFSIDDGTGNFVNDSQEQWTTPEEIQVIKTITAIKGQEVRWKWFFTDGAGNNNVTSIWSFIVANSPPTHSSPLLQATSVYNSSSDNLTCYNQSTQDLDEDEVINVYSWIKNSQSLASLNLPFEINADDYSSNDNDGTIYGATFTTGKVGRALQFDGINDYVKVEENFGTSFNSFSVEAWVNLKNIATQHKYILERDDTHFYISIMPGKKVRFRHSDLTNGATETEPNAIEFDEWTHIAVVYNGTKTYIYVNGQLKKEQDNTGSISFSATEPLYIGSSKYALSYPDRTWNGSIDEIRIYNYALSAEQISSHYILEYNKIVSQETTAGETYQCSVTPNDQEEDGTQLDSNPLTILYKITFDVRSGEDNSSIKNFNIYCDNDWQVSGEDSPYSTSFLPSSYECLFEQAFYFNETISFTVDADKTVPVKMSESGKLTIEEHTWLEALYKCIILEDCSLYNLLLEINSTVGNIWEHTKPTNENVVTFENITNKIVDSSHNLTIDYTVHIPIKAGYATGTYLPVRIGFWFLDENNESCYDQGDRPTSVSEPYCQPLIIETIGPMDGSISFTVELQPQLPAGDYNIKRMIDIDPDNIWINYGQEEIGIFTATEDINDFGINLKITSETTSEESVSIEEAEEIVSEEQTRKDNIKSSGGITGAIIGETKEFFTNNQTFVLILVGMICITFIIVSNKFFKYKK
jgi:hypothetical protein